MRPSRNRLQKKNRRSRLQSLEQRLLLAADPYGTNALQPLDVSRDGNVSAIDALQVINAVALTSDGLAAPADSLGRFIDVNGDGDGTVLDALRVINRLATGEPIIAATLSDDSAPRPSVATEGDPFDLLTNDYRIDLNVSLADRGDLKVEIRLNGNGDFVDVSDRFTGNQATLTATDIDSVYGGPLPDGDHRIELRMGDGTPLDFVLTVDRGVPSVERIDLDGEFDSGNLRDGATTFESVTLVGILEPDVTIEEGGNVFSSGSEGRFQLESIPLAIGDNQFDFEVFDRAGNSISLPRVFERIEIDQPPQISTVDPIAVTVGDHFSQTIVVQDDVATSVALSISSSNDLPPGQLTSDGVLTFRPGPDDVGEYEFTITASDGRSETNQTVSLTVEADPITTTRLSGAVLSTELEPLAGVPVAVGVVETITDANGEFTLDFGNVPFPGEKLLIKGALFVGDEVYPTVAERMDLVVSNGPFDSIRNRVDRPIYLPALDVAGGETIDPAAETIVQQELSGGGMAIVTVDQGTLKDQAGNDFSGVLSITEVPPSLTPAALPRDVVPDTVVTVQPGEMNFDRPSAISLPNRAGLTAGTELELWSINHLTGDFDVVGMGRVTNDGTMIETVQGGIRSSSWHFFNPRPNREPFDPNQNNRTPFDKCNTCSSGVGGSSSGSSVGGVSLPTGSDVMLHSGEYVEYHSLPTYQSQGVNRGVSLTYRSMHADPRPIIHFGYGNVGQNRIFANAELRVDGVDILQRDSSAPESGSTHYWAASGDAFAALQLDLRGTPTGVYDYMLMYGTGAFRPLNGNEALDGATNGRMREYRGSVVSINSVNSPFGAGWSIDGWMQLVENADGSVMLFDATGETVFDTPSLDGTFRSPPGDYSDLEKSVDGTFSHTTVDQTVTLFNADNMISSVTDRNGNQTIYGYDSEGQLSTITDPVGLETTLQYDNGLLRSITDPAGRTTEFSHDEFGNLVQIIAPDQSERIFDYDEGHRIVAETNENGDREFTSYGFHGRVESVTRRDGNVMTFQPAQVQGLFPPDETRDFADAPEAISYVDAITRYTDASGDEKSILLDASGQEISSTDSVGQTDSIRRNTENEITSVDDARGNLSRYIRDERGNTTLISDNETLNGGVVSGRLRNAGDRHLHPFTVAETTFVHFDELDQDTGISFSIEDSEGSLIDDQLSLFNDDDVLRLEPGSYQVVVDGETNATGNYAFRMRDFSAAIPLELGETITLTAPQFEFSDSSLFQFDAVAGDSFFFDLSSSTQLRLVAPNGSLLGLSETLIPFVSDRIVQDLPSDGTYTLIASLNRDSTLGFYQMTAPTPIELQVGQRYTAALDTPGSSQSYTLTVEHDQSFYLDTLTNTGNATFTVDGPFGRIIDNRTFAVQDWDVEVERLAPGDYVMTVQTFGDSTGTADFIVHDLDDAMVITPGVHVNGDLTEGVETDLYQMDVNAGDVFNLQVIDTDSTNPHWRLISPMGDELFEQRINADIEGIVAPAAGTYTLLIEGDQNEVGTPNYTINIDPMGTVPLVPPSGTPISVGQDVAGSLGTSDEIDEYLISVNETTYLYLDSLSDTSSFELNISSPFASVYSTTLGTSSSDDLVLVPGDYQIKVESRNSSSGDYSFRLSDLRSAQLLTLSQTTPLTFPNGRTAQLRSFDASAGDAFYWDAGSLDNFPGSGQVSLLGPSGERLGFSSGSLSLQRSDQLITLGQTGKHTFVIEANTDDTDAEFDFVLTPVVEQTPESLTLGETVSGETLVPQQPERYTFTVDKRTRIHFDALTDISGPTPNWTLIGPSRNVVRPASSFVSSSVELLPAGSYELRVVANSSENLGAFSFRVLDLDDAAAVDLDQRIDREMESPLQTDSFSIDLQKGERYFFDAHTESLLADAGVNWTLFDPNNNQVFNQNMRYLPTTTTGTGDVDLVADASGTYTLLVRGPSRVPSAPLNYGFEVRTFQPPVSEPFTFGQSLSISIDSPGERAVYDFTIPTEQRVVIDTPGNLDFAPLLTLTGPSGTVLKDQPLASVFDSLFLVAGDYSLEVKGVQDQVGTAILSAVLGSTAQPIDLANNLSGQTTPGVAKLYAFDASDGDSLTINRVSASDSDVEWTLYDPIGNRVQSRTLGTTQTEADLEITGGYVLEVANRDLNGVDPNTRSFELNFAVDTSGQTDPTGGTPISIGEVINVNLQGDQTAVYQFSTDTPGGLLINRLSDNQLRYKVFGNVARAQTRLERNRVFVSTNGQSQTDQSEIYLAGGDYIVEVEGSGNDVGDFSFSLEQLPVGTNTVVGETVSGQLTSLFEAQTFTFDANQGATLLLDMVRLDSFPQTYTVFDDFGSRIFTTNIAEEFEIPHTGTFTLRVENSAFGDPTTNFQFRLIELVSTVDRSVSIESNSFEQFEYDPEFNQLTRYVDAKGNQTLYRLDPTTGNTTTIIEVVGALDSDPSTGNDIVTQVTYTDDGQIDTVTDAMGRVTDNEYDDSGRLVSTTVAVGTAVEATTRYEYDAAGNLITLIDERDNLTRYEHDSLGRIVKITEPDPDGSGPLQSPETAFRYDHRGNLVALTDAQGNETRQTFDAMDRLSIVTTPDDAQTIRNYDGDGNLLSVTDPLGQMTSYQYDSRDRLIATTDPDGGITQFEYDDDDNLIALVDPVLNRTEFEFDSRTRLQREIDPLGKETTYEYDRNDNLAAMTDRNGRTTRYAYDTLDRMTTEIWLDSNDTALNTIVYTYDEVGNQLTLGDNQSDLAFSYDDRNRVRTADNAGTPDVPQVLLTYQYDAAGNVVSVTDSISGSTDVATNYQYDGLNRLVELTQLGNATQEKRVDLAYNALGQYTSLNRFSDLSGTQSVAQTAFTYDSRNRLTDLRHSNATEDFAFYEFTYDTDNRITSINDVDGLTGYTYDDRDQLIGADRASDDTRGDETYQYDANGNRVESHLHNDGYSTGPGNRLLSDGTYNYTYDGEGNRLTQTNIATGEVRTFTWDHRNRLVAIEDRDASNAFIQRVAFTYDVTGRRLSKSVDTATADEVVTHFVYDREDVILDFVQDNAGTNLDQRYLHGPGIDEVLAQESGTGEVLWMATDHLGTTRDLVDRNGAVLHHLDYDSFGRALNDAAAVLSTRYQFTGREFDQEIDLQFSRARYFNAATGSFLSEDPIGFSGGTPHLMSYVGNSPIAFVDADGKKRTTVQEKINQCKAKLKKQKEECKHQSAPVGQIEPKCKKEQRTLEKNLEFHEADLANCELRKTQSEFSFQPIKGLWKRIYDSVRVCSERTAKPNPKPTNHSLKK